MKAIILTEYVVHLLQMYSLVDRFSHNVVDLVFKNL